MKKLTLLLLCLFALTVSIAVQPAAAAPATVKPWVLHRYSYGPRVRALQWLLAGHKPSHYRGLATYRGPIDGHFGPTTAKAVTRIKYRLGYPQKRVTPTASKLLFQILEGKVRRPVSWIGLAARRHKAEVAAEKRRAQLNACQRRVVRLAESQVSSWSLETWGYNWGPRVRDYQSATGAYRSAWCVSFVQWVLKNAGYGTVANRSASVWGVRDWAYRNGLLRATPRPGAIALFGNDHAGIVTSVGRYGFTTIDGNWGNGVRRVYHPYYSTHIGYVWLPRCSYLRQLGMGDDHSPFDEVPWWAWILGAGVSLATASAGLKLRARRAARKAVHELAEMFEELEDKLEDKQ